MQTLILSLHVIVCVTLVILVLLQAGKEGMGVIFGGGNASVFGSSGAGGLLAKMTAFMAVLFIVTSLSYNYVSSSHKAQESTILTSVWRTPQNLPLPLPRFPQLLLKSPLRLPLPTSPPTKHHPKYAFEAMKQFMASFFIRARPQNLPPFLLELAKRQRPRYCPTTVFLAHS